MADLGRERRKNARKNMKHVVRSIGPASLRSGPAGTKQNKTRRRTRADPQKRERRKEREKKRREEQSPKAATMSPGSQNNYQNADEG